MDKLWTNCGLRAEETKKMIVDKQLVKGRGPKRDEEEDPSKSQTNRQSLCRGASNKNKLAKMRVRSLAG